MTLNIQDYRIKLPYLPSHSRLYVIVEIKIDRKFIETEKKDSAEMISSLLFMKKHKRSPSDRYSIASRLNDYSETIEFYAELEYTSNNTDLIETSNTLLDYSVPLSITSKLSKHSDLLILKIQVLNCSHLSIKILNWSLYNCIVLQDPNYEVVLKTAQIHHFSFILSEAQTSAKIVFKYRSSLRTHERKMHIDPEIDKKMKSQEFSIEHIFLAEESAVYQISEPVVLGKESLLTITLVSGRAAKVRIEKSGVWVIDSPDVLEFADKCVLKITPCKAGNLSAPEIIIWVGQKSIKVDGPKKVFVSPFIKNK
jgi:hypothetical protein